MKLQWPAGPVSPPVAREDATLIASKSSKLLHRVDCPAAPVKGVYYFFESTLKLAAAAQVARPCNFFTPCRV